MNRRIFFPLVAIASLAVVSTTQAANLPTRVGECVDTRIKSVETRLEGVPGSGDAVSFENGGYQVSYDSIPAIQRSQKGDPVKMCLVSIPQDCPAGDARGRVYKTTNLRTHETWREADSSHMCGGA
jgi:hypothetical protein